MPQAADASNAAQCHRCHTGPQQMYMHLNASPCCALQTKRLVAELEQRNEQAHTKHVCTRHRLHTCEAHRGAFAPKWWFS